MAKLESSASMPGILPVASPRSQLAGLPGSTATAPRPFDVVIVPDFLGSQAHLQEAVAMQPSPNQARDAATGKEDARVHGSRKELVIPWPRKPFGRGIAITSPPWARGVRFLAHDLPGARTLNLGEDHVKLYKQVQQPPNKTDPERYTIAGCERLLVDRTAIQNGLPTNTL